MGILNELVPCLILQDYVVVHWWFVNHRFKKKKNARTKMIYLKQKKQGDLISSHYERQNIYHLMTFLGKNSSMSSR